MRSHMNDLNLTKRQRQILLDLAPTPERLVWLVRQYGNAIRRANVRAERKAARELLSVMLSRKPSREQIDNAIPDLPCIAHSSMSVGSVWDGSTPSWPSAEPGVLPQPLWLVPLASAPRLWPASPAWPLRVGPSRI